MAFFRPLVAAAALLAILVIAPAAAANPNLTLSAPAPSSILYGDEAEIALTAANPAGQPAGYNLSFRAVLPAGVTFVPGSGPAGVPAQVINNAPAAGQQTLVFSNVSDLSANSSYVLRFRVAHDTAILDAGDTFTVSGGAYVNTDARYVPQFSAGGVPDPASYTGSATTTHDVTLLPFRVIREAPDDQLRGAHDFQYRTRITIENNKVRPTTALSLTDYAPAGVEVLACGTADFSAGPEYTGSGPLNTGSPPALGNCLAPTQVTTVTANPGGLGNGTWTRQVWNGLGALAPGGTLTIDFATAIPIRENTTSWPGAVPAQQWANLDNNTGPETYDEQALTAYTSATGLYDGTVSSTATDTQTTVAEDLTLAKSASSPTIAIGATTTWTLTASASEYRWVDDTVIVDTVPDGLCPLGAADFDADSAECDHIAASDPYASVTENPNGTWTVIFDPLARIAPSGSRSVQLVTRTRAEYQENGADDGDVLSHDAWTNFADVSGDDYVICAGGASYSDCAGGSRIDADEADGDPDIDAASAAQTALAPTLDKQVGVAASGTNCLTAAYTTASNERYGPGDRVCWRLRMDFPAGTPTGNVQVSDFLPLGHHFEAGSVQLTANNTVPIDSSDFTVPGLLTWRLGTGGVAGQSQVFEAVVSTIVDEQVDPAFPGQLTQNLLKSNTTNTADTTFPLRDDAGVVIAAPVVALDKSVVDVDGAAPVGSPPQVHPDDVVTYRVRVSNTGERDASDVEVWDNLPPQFTCATVVSAGTCDDGTHRITWTVPGIPAGGSVNLDYDVTIPITGAGRTFTNTAGVRTYASVSNLGTTHDYYPTSNIDPSVAALENAAQANDSQSVATPAITVTKNRTTEVNESGNNAASQATIGELVTYTVSFTVPAHTQLFGSPQLDDPLTSRQTLVPGSLSTGALPGGVTAAEVGNGVRLTFPADYVAGASDETYTLTYQAQVDDDHPANRRGGAALTNTATLTYQSQPGTTVNRTATTSTTIVEPNLQATKTTTEADLTVEPAQELGFTVTARNVAGAGVSVAHQVSLVDTVPAGLTPLSGPGGSPVADGGIVGPDNGVWNAAARTITWPAVATIAPGASAARTYTVRVDDPAVSQAALQNTFATTTSSLGAAQETGGERSAPTPAAGYAGSAQVTLHLVGLSLAKAMTPATQTVGGVVTGTLTVTVPANVGLFDAHITDLLPDGLVFDGYDTALCTSGCGPAIVPSTLPTQDAGLGRTRLGWWIGDVAPHTSVRTLELTYRAHVAATRNAGDALVNSAQWHLNRTDQIGGTPITIPALADVDSSPSTDTTTVTEPQLVLDKDVSGDANDDDLRTAEPGDTFTYSIAVTNTGNHPAYDVVVTDAPDAELVAIAPTTNASLLTDGWSSGDPDMAWQIAGPIAPGATVTLAYTAELAPSAQLTPASSAVNTADVTSYWGVGAAERQANGFTYREYTVVPDDTVTLDLDTPQVTVAKAATGGPAAAVGVSYAWEITLTNTATAASAHDADVEDVLPPNWTYDAGSATVGGTPAEPTVTPDAAGDVLRWDDVADLAPGDSVVIALTATPRLAAALVPGTGAGNPHVNTASVSGVRDSAGATADGDGSYSGPADTAQTILTVPATDLAIDKTTTTPPVAGGPVAWQITVTNNGPDGSPSVQVADTVPPGVTVTSAVASQGSCDTTIACTLGEIANGASATIDVTGTVDDAASQGVTLTNTATVSDPAITDTDPSNDSGQAVDSILERAALTLDKTALDPIVSGRSVRWQLTVAHAGPSVARAVTVTDTLPAGVTFTSGSPGCAHAAGVVTCTVGDLAPGQVATLTITTTVDATNGSIQNTATATSPTPDGGGGPSTATDDAGGSVTRPDLAIAQFVDGTAEPGATVDYTLMVSNAGTAPPYAPTTVVATMPAGLIPVAASGSGWSCKVTGQQITCTRSGGLAPGASFPAIHIATRVTAAAGTMLNVVATVATAGDLVPANNRSQTAIVAAPEAVATCTGGGELLVTPTRLWAGARYRVTGRVVAADGRVVPGQSVRVQGAGRRALVLRTSAHGAFSFTARPASGATRYRLTTPGCGLRATVTARRAPSCRSLTVRPGSLEAGEAARVRIRLRAGKRALGFAAVHLRGAGIDRTVRTDGDGRASVRVRPQQAGIVSVSATRVASCARRVGVVAGATARQLTG